MSIIWLKNRLTKDSEIYENYKKSDNSYIFFSEDIDRLEDEFSLDISFKSAESITKRKRKIMRNSEDLAEKKEIIIPPHTSVHVESCEYIAIPYNVYGLVMPSGKLLFDKGILVPTTKIEPSFEGYLKIFMYNTTEKSVHLNLDTKAVSLVFFSMNHLLNSKKMFSTMAPKYTAPGIWKRIQNKFNNNHVLLQMLATIVSAIIGAFIGLAFAGW